MIAPPVAWLAPATIAMRSFLTARCPPELRLLTAPAGDVIARRAMLSEAEGIITGGARLSAADLAQAPRLRGVQLVGVGWQDRVPSEAMRNRDIRLATCAVGSAQAVAEHALMLMLAVQRRLLTVDRALRSGVFDPATQRLTAHRLFGSTVGLLGMGAIARQLAVLLQPFGVHVLYWSRTRLSMALEARFAVQYRPIEALLGQADIVSLHLPGGAGTRHLLGAREFARMKSGAIIVNTARGSLIDRDALLSALRSGQLGGAGLDVFDPEPPDLDDPLLALESVVLTPHSASAQLETFAEKVDFCFANLVSLFTNGSWTSEISL